MSRASRRWVLLALTMAALLIPREGVSLFAVMILAFPVAISGVKDFGTFRWWAVYVLGFTVFVKLRDWADLVMPVQVEYPIILSRWLGLGELPVIRLQQVYTPGAPAWWDYAAIAVYLTHFFAFPVVGIMVWRIRPHTLKPYLFGFTLTLAVSVLVHFLLPTAPPWMAGQMGALPVVYAILGDVLGGHIPGFYEYGLHVAGGNAVAAMPSVHAAAATMVALSSLGTRWAWLGVGYAVAMTWSLVYLGQHYLVDTLAGTLLAIVCWRWVRHRRLQSAEA